MLNTHHCTSRHIWYGNTQLADEAINDAIHPPGLSISFVTMSSGMRGVMLSLSTPSLFPFSPSTFVLGCSCVWVKNLFCKSSTPIEGIPYYVITIRYWWSIACVFWTMSYFAGDVYVNDVKCTTVKSFCNANCTWIDDKMLNLDHPMGPFRLHNYHRGTDVQWT